MFRILSVVISIVVASNQTALPIFGRNESIATNHTLTNQTTNFTSNGYPHNMTSVARLRNHFARPLSYTGDSSNQSTAAMGNHTGVLLCNLSDAGMPYNSTVFSGNYTGGIAFNGTSNATASPRFTYASSSHNSTASAGNHTNGLLYNLSDAGMPYNSTAFPGNYTDGCVLNGTVDATAANNTGVFAANRTTNSTGYPRFR
jgi:hypothetical protein